MNTTSTVTTSTILLLVPPKELLLLVLELALQPGRLASDDTHTFEPVLHPQRSDYSNILVKSIYG